MRLAFLTHEPFFPPTGGGSAEAVYLVREFLARGHEVDVFSPPSEDPEGQVDRRVRLHPFETWRMGRYARWRTVKYLLYPVFLQRLVEREARRQRFDLLFSQHTISAVAAGRLKRRLKVSVVMNFLDFLTGFMETWPDWMMPPPLLASLERYETHLPQRADADGVLAVSEVLAERFARTGYPRERVLAMGYGFDAERFAPGPERAVEEGRPSVVMHGSFDLHHLGPIALDALEEVSRRRPEVVFRFLGRRTPALNRFVEAAKRRGFAEAIQTTDFIPYARIAAELRRATVGIVPYEESNGTHSAFVAKVVEYLAVGLPVVSTPLAAMRRYFKHEPMLRFSGFDGPSFAERILETLNEPAERHRALGEQAAQRAKAELDWRAVCGRAVAFTETVWQRVCEGGDRS